VGRVSLLRSFYREKLLTAKRAKEICKAKDLTAEDAEKNSVKDAEKPQFLAGVAKL
jgi:hypothetical protein